MTIEQARSYSPSQSNIPSAIRPAPHANSSIPVPKLLKQPHFILQERRKAQLLVSSLQKEMSYKMINISTYSHDIPGLLNELGFEQQIRELFKNENFETTLSRRKIWRRLPSQVYQLARYKKLNCSMFLMLHFHHSQSQNFFGQFIQFQTNVVENFTSKLPMEKRYRDNLTSVSICIYR